MGRKSHEFPTTRRYLHICDHCGVEFRSARKDAKTCSPRCRKARHRNGKGRKEVDYMATEAAARQRNEREAIDYALKHLGKN